MGLKAVFLNCTLKYLPDLSETRELIDRAAEIFGEMGIESEIIRITDYNIKFGKTFDMGGDDEWPGIYEIIRQSDIVVIGSPVSSGVRSSVAQLVIERLYGSYSYDSPDTGHNPLYGKVAGVIISGEEDGAYNVAADTLFDLNCLGCIIPPNAGGDKQFYTNLTVGYMIRNLAWMANLLKESKTVQI